MQFFTAIALYSGDMTRDVEAEVAIRQLIDKGKQFW